MERRSRPRRPRHGFPGAGLGGLPRCRRRGRRNDDRVHVREVFQDLQADRRVSGDDRLVADGMDEMPLDPGIAVVLEDLPPAGIGKLHRLRPQAPDSGQLRVRGALGHDDRAGDAEPLCVPADPLRHVAGARRVDALREALLRQESHGIAGAAQLERADRLKVLELQPDLRPRVLDVQAHERRADRRPRDAAARRPDVLEARRLNRSRGGSLRIPGTVRSPRPGLSRRCAGPTRRPRRRCRAT